VKKNNFDFRQHISLGTPNSIGTMVLKKEGEIQDENEQALSLWASMFYEQMNEYLTEPPKFIEL
jgi:hypothetical protein